MSTAEHDLSATDTTVIVKPSADQTHQIVVPITVNVMPIATTSGRIEPPGRWISSPAGGTASVATTA